MMTRGSSLFLKLIVGNMILHKETWSTKPFNLRAVKVNEEEYQNELGRMTTLRMNVKDRVEQLVLNVTWNDSDREQRFTKDPHSELKVLQMLKRGVLTCPKQTNHLIVYRRLPTDYGLKAMKVPIVLESSSRIASIIAIEDTTDEKLADVIGIPTSHLYDTTICFDTCPKKTIEVQADNLTWFKWLRREGARVCTTRLGYMNIDLIMFLAWTVEDRQWFVEHMFTDGKHSLDDWNTLIVRWAGSYSLYVPMLSMLDGAFQFDVITSISECHVTCCVTIKPTFYYNNNLLLSMMDDNVNNMYEVLYSHYAAKCEGRFLVYDSDDDDYEPPCKKPRPIDYSDDENMDESSESGSESECDSPEEDEMTAEEFDAIIDPLNVNKID